MRYLWITLLHGKSGVLLPIQLLLLLGCVSPPCCALLLLGSVSPRCCALLLRQLLLQQQLLMIQLVLTHKLMRGRPGLPPLVAGPTREVPGCHGGVEGRRVVGGPAGGALTDGDDRRVHCAAATNNG